MQNKTEKRSFYSGSTTASVTAGKTSIIKNKKTKILKKFWRAECPEGHRGQY